MPVKISSYLSLREDLETIIERDLYYDEEKEKLKSIIKEINELYNNFKDLDISQENPLIMLEKGLLLSNIVEIKPKTTHNKRIGELLEGIHEVIQNYHVWPSVYRSLGGSFVDVEEMPKFDTMLAIIYGNELAISSDGTVRAMTLFEESIRKMWWKMEKGTAERAYNNWGVVHAVNEEDLEQVINEDLINKCDKIAWKIGHSTTDSDWYSEAQYKDDALFIESHTNHIRVEYNNSRVFEAKDYFSKNLIFKPKKIMIKNKKYYIYKFKPGKWIDNINKLHYSFSPKKINIDWEED